MEPLLRGDSNNVRLDAIPGDSFRDMIYNLEEWLAVYMPDISDVDEDSAGNVILASIAKTAEEAKKFGDKEFQKSIEKGIHVNPPVASVWWNDMLKSWAEDNYTLITSNAKKYITQINVLTEQAIVNGLSPKTLKEQIKKATESLSDKHCKLLARDQMGKLNGQISQAQSQELGLELYVWSTSMDDRVRESHQLMEGLLCRYDDATVCSYDNGKTWVDRPSGAVQLHPGQDIQCRCVGSAFYPELEAEMKKHTT
jgi:SPP1 gp7 family putative phage head morphogenesis protein